VAENLTGLVRQAHKVNLLQGVKVGRHEVDVCMLQFADDTLFLCETAYDNVVAIKAIMRCYELASGFKINFSKSKMADINVERNSLVCFAKSLNCTQMMVPFMYLGGNPRKKQFWEPMVNKISNKLSFGKGRFLSLARRICLIKSVFIVVPLLYLSFFKAPKSMCKNIMQRRLL